MPFLPPRPRLEAYRAWWIGGLLAASPLFLVFGPLMGVMLAAELWTLSLVVGFELSRPVLKSPRHDQVLAVALRAAALAPAVALVSFLALLARSEVREFLEDGDVGVVFVAGFALEAATSLTALWFIFKRRGTPTDFKAFRVLLVACVPLGILLPGMGLGSIFAWGLGALGAGFLVFGWLRILWPKQAVTFDPIFGPEPTAPKEQPVFRAFRAR